MLERRVLTLGHSWTQVSALMCQQSFVSFYFTLVCLYCLCSVRRIRERSLKIQLVGKHQ